MNTFDVMGVAPLVGRGTSPADAAEGAEAVVVLGYKFWQRQFGGDRSVLGRKLRLNDKIRTVIGVMPPRFMWRGAAVSLPDVFHRGQTVEGERSVHLLGRLKPGISREQALAGLQPALQPILEDLERTYPGDFPKPWRIRLESLGETFPSGIQDALWILFGAVGLLLLIACVNVSNLLLSRGAYRRREMAIRAAMGAGSFRIVRQLLAESLLLALGGGAAGVLLAYAGLRGIVAVVPPNTIPDEARITLNAPVLGFTLAVSVVLLVGASLMIRTLLSIQGANLAFHPDRILTLRIPFSEQRYPDAKRRNAFLRDVLGRMQTAPGVLAVGINAGLPPVYNWIFPAEAVGSSQTERRPVLVQQTNADYLRVMGLRVVQGRFLNEAEVEAQRHSVAVN